MKTHILVLAGTLLFTLTTLTFLTDEYNLWDQSLTCNAKCTALGCKGGTLMTNEQQSTVACRCASEQDYLIVIN